MDESLFYIAGGALIAVALILSLVGMRSDRFPSGNVLAAGIVVVFLLVAATAVGAVELAQHESGERLEEANLEADQGEAEETAEGEEAGAAPAPTPDEPKAGEKGGKAGGSGLDGGQVFVSVGCGSCHTIAELGDDAAGTIGPNLDTALAGKDDAFIEESIVDPSAVVAKGFPDGTMPATYGTELSPEEIDALVAFLSKTAGN
jgi:mono/diheme cytochrome c family protein